MDWKKEAMDKLRQYEARKKEELVQRLAAYENTGLEPEDIKALTRALLDATRRGLEPCEICAKNHELTDDCDESDCNCEICKAECVCAGCTDASKWEWRRVSEARPGGGRNG